jgi:hypothetical protein
MFLTDDKRVREQLTECIRGTEGLELLKNELAQVPSSASVLAFLASVIKDYSGKISLF